MIGRWTLLALLLAGTTWGAENPPGSTPSPAAAVVPEGGPSPTVDFATQIQPVFTQHCVRCHGSAKRDGDLRLDSREGAMHGGDSGLNALALPVERNEILRRLRSTEPGDRMPLEGDPLPPETIQTIETWIREGASWPAPPQPMIVAYQPVWWERIATYLLERYDRWGGPLLKPAVPFFIGVLILILILERAKETRRKRLTRGESVGRWTERIASLSRVWGLVGLLLVMMLGSYLLVRVKLEELPKLQKEVTRLNGLVSMTDPFPNRWVRPHHPARMGGKYYRGNDERSPALYNGGYYRTATLDLRLDGPDGRRLIWGDELPARANIVVEIEKSPFAAPSLFTGEMMAAVGMTDVAPADLASQSVGHEGAFLKPAAREGVWAIEFPIVLDRGKPTNEGMVYLYNSFRKNDIGTLSGTCHFAIGYKLLTGADGKLTPESQVWMEAVVKPGNIHWVPEGQIGAQEWFDVLPIPEIEGGNTSDPKLLGVEEHLEKLRKLREAEEQDRQARKAREAAPPAATDAAAKGPESPSPESR